MTAFTINLNSIIKLTDDQFYQICRHNPEIKFERNAKEELIIMSPTGGGTGKRNIEIGADFVIWNRKTKLGVCFDSSTCFKLPNGADRSPDVSWIKPERWDRTRQKLKGKRKKKKNRYRADKIDGKSNNIFFETHRYEQKR